MNEEPYTLLERAQNREHEKILKEERELIVEWWEIWNRKGEPNARRILPDTEEISKNLLMPVHGFESKEAAKKVLERMQGPHLKLVHVRRTRKAKQ